MEQKYSDDGINDQLCNIFKLNNRTICLLCMENINCGTHTSIDRDKTITSHLQNELHQMKLKTLFKECVHDPSIDCEDQKYSAVVSNLVFDLSLYLGNEPTYISQRGFYIMCHICSNKLSEFSIDENSMIMMLYDHLQSRQHKSNLKNWIRFIYFFNAKREFVIISKSDMYCSLCKMYIKSMGNILLQTMINHLENEHGNVSQGSSGEMVDTELMSRYNHCLQLNTEDSKDHPENGLTSVRNIAGVRNNDNTCTEHESKHGNSPKHSEGVGFFEDTLFHIPPSTSNSIDFSKEIDTHQDSDSTTQKDEPPQRSSENGKKKEEQNCLTGTHTGSEDAHNNDVIKYGHETDEDENQDNIEDRPTYNHTFLSDSVKLKRDSNVLNEHGENSESTVNSAKINYEEDSDDLKSNDSIQISNQHQHFEMNAVGLRMDECIESNANQHTPSTSITGMVENGNTKYESQNLSSTENCNKYFVDESEPLCHEAVDDGRNTILRIGYNPQIIIGDSRENRRKENVARNEFNENSINYSERFALKNYDNYPNTSTEDGTTYDEVGNHQQQRNSDDGDMDADENATSYCETPSVNDNSNNEEELQTELDSESSETEDYEEALEAVTCPVCDEFIEIINDNVEFSLQLHSQKHKDLKSCNSDRELEFNLNVDYVCPVCQEVIPIFNKNIELSVNRHFEERKDDHEGLGFAKNNEVAPDLLAQTFSKFPESLKKYESFTLMEGNTIFCKLCNCTVSSNICNFSEILSEHLFTSYHEEQFKSLSQDLAMVVVDYNKQCTSYQQLEQPDLFETLVKKHPLIQKNRKFIEKKKMHYFCQICKKHICYSPNEANLKLNFMLHFKGLLHERALKQMNKRSDKACGNSEQESTSKQSIKKAERRSRKSVLNKIFNTSRKSCAVLLNHRYIKNRNGDFLCNTCQTQIKFTEDGCHLIAHCTSSRHNEILSRNASIFVSKLQNKNNKMNPCKISKELKVVLSDLATCEYLKPHLTYIYVEKNNCKCLVCNVVINRTKQKIQRHIFDANHQKNAFTANQQVKGCPQLGMKQTDAGRQSSFGFATDKSTDAGRQSSFGLATDKSTDAGRQSSFGLATDKSIDAGRQSSFGLATDKSTDAGRQSSFGLATDKSTDAGRQSSFGLATDKSNYLQRPLPESLVPVTDSKRKRRRRRR